MLQAHVHRWKGEWMDTINCRMHQKHAHNRRQISDDVFLQQTNRDDASALSDVTSFQITLCDTYKTKQKCICWKHLRGIFNVLIWDHRRCIKHSNQQSISCRAVDLEIGLHISQLHCTTCRAVKHNSSYNAGCGNSSCDICQKIFPEWQRDCDCSTQLCRVSRDFSNISNFSNVFEWRTLM